MKKITKKFLALTLTIVGVVSFVITTEAYIGGYGVCIDYVEGSDKESGCTFTEYYYHSDGIYIPEVYTIDEVGEVLYGEVLHAGLVTDDDSDEQLAKEGISEIKYTCTVVDYDYEWYSQFFDSPQYPMYAEFTNKDSKCIAFEPKHSGGYGICFREYHNGDMTKCVAERWAKFEVQAKCGDTDKKIKELSGGRIYIPDLNKDVLDFGMVFEAKNRDDVHITWFLYDPDKAEYEAVLADGTVGELGEWQSWKKQPGRHWVMCRITSGTYQYDTESWGVEIKDGVVR